MSPTFVRAHTHTYLMVNENEYLARAEQLIYQKSGASISRIWVYREYSFIPSYLISNNPQNCPGMICSEA